MILIGGPYDGREVDRPPGGRDRIIFRLDQLPTLKEPDVDGVFVEKQHVHVYDLDHESVKDGYIYGRMYYRGTEKRVKGHR
jgi:hypothetical protein